MPDTNITSIRQPDFAATREFDIALVDAGNLLEHAASVGLFPDEGPNAAGIVIRDLVQAQEAARTGTLTAQITIAFWIAYGRLARLSAPVSAASLTGSRHVRMMGMKIRATLVVLLVIASSIFLFMSTATLNETHTSRTLPPLSCGQTCSFFATALVVATVSRRRARPASAIACSTRRSSSRAGAPRCCNPRSGCTPRLPRGGSTYRATMSRSTKTTKEE